MFRLLSLLFALSVVTVSAHAKQHNVTVGGPGILAYDPEYVVADPGDTVLFVFHQKNHTLTQSTFADPCTPVAGGFDTGFQAIAPEDSEGPFPGAEITVTTTTPVWSFCRQPGHCQQGMVFAINPGNKFDAFKANAMGVAGSTTPSSSTVASSSHSDQSTHTTASPSHTSTPSSTTLTVEATTFTLDLPTGTIPDSVITFSLGDLVPSSSSTSHVSIPTSIATDYWVTVGANSQLSFNPTNITAHVGDTITFEFRPANHSIKSSSFAAPCTPLSETNASAVEIIDSGFHVPAEGTSNFPTYTIQVNTTEPLWMFSAQPGECGKGMVFAVNAPNDDFAVFESKAIATNSSQLATNGKNFASRSSPADAGVWLAGALLSILFFS